MNMQMQIARGTDLDALVGRTVYFQAYRAVRRECQKWETHSRKGLTNQYFYDLIPGRVISPNDNETGVIIRAGSGMYNRPVDELVLEEQLDDWMSRHPRKHVLQEGKA